MKKKAVDRVVSKQIIALLCLLVASISMCACNSELKPPAPVNDFEEYIQESAYEETEPQKIGILNIEDLANEDGFFIKYPDGSFDEYRTGTVINWGMPQYYTYGTEWCPANVVLPAEKDALNVENLKKGTLVFKTSQTDKIVSGIYPVIESGFAMHGKSADDCMETLFWLDEKGIDCWVVDGSKKEPGYVYNFSRIRDIVSINGMSPGSDPIFEKEENKNYVTLQEGETYVIGEAKGTTLIESEYKVDMKYYLSTLDFFEEAYEYSEKYYSLELQPTTDGYAVVDFTDIPAGDHIITYSYWDEEYDKRRAYITHVCVE